MCLAGHAGSFFVLTNKKKWYLKGMSDRYVLDAYKNLIDADELSRLFNVGIAISDGYDSEFHITNDMKVPFLLALYVKRIVASDSQGYGIMVYNETDIRLSYYFYTTNTNIAVNYNYYIFDSGESFKFNSDNNNHLLMMGIVFEH